jgi:hypothetical protein
MKGDSGMNFSLFLRLLLGHLLGDFYLQNDSLCEGKEHSLVKLLQHCFIYSFILFAFLGTWGKKALIAASIIFLSHFLLDYFKIKLEGRPGPKVETKKTPSISASNNWRLFLLDQAGHVLVLFGVWIMIQGPFFWSEFYPYFFGLVVDTFTSRITLLLFLAYLTVGLPTGIAVAFLTRRWSDEIRRNQQERVASSEKDDQTDLSGTTGLLKGGKWIGILERLFVLTFVLTGHIEGIGFLVTAKSIFRFGEFNRENTEYILIGTMLSFFIAMAVGLTVNYLLARSGIDLTAELIP